MKPLVFVLVLSVALAAPPDRGEAAVYNLHLVTDKVPDYTDMPSLAHSTADLWQTPQDKAIAVWRWGRRSRRQTSCAGEDGRTIWDPILHYNSYGAMNCGIISSLNIASWLELGFRGRYIQLGDHTVSEVSWDDGKTWHLFDSSMSMFCYNHEGQVASCDEIQEAHACELSGGKSERGHFYYYHFTPPCGSHFGPTGWRFACDNPVENERTLFNGADSYMHNFHVDRYCQYARTGHRYVLGVRPYESYTRYWEPLDRPRPGPSVLGAPPGAAGPLAASDPDYFRPIAKGFLDPDDPHGPMDIRGNGQWVFQPDLAAKDWRECLYDDSGLAAEADGSGPRLHPAQAGQPAFAVFKISAANVITSMRIEADGLRRTGVDALKISVSRNAGMRWSPVWQADSCGAAADPPQAPRRGGGRHAMPDQDRDAGGGRQAGRRPRYAEGHHHYAAQPPHAPQAGPGRQPGHALGRRATGNHRGLAALARRGVQADRGRGRRRLERQGTGRLLRSHSRARRQRQGVFGYLEAGRAQRDPRRVLLRGEHDSHRAVTTCLCDTRGTASGSPSSTTMPADSPSPWTSKCTTSLPAATCRPGPGRPGSAAPSSASRAPQASSRRASRTCSSASATSPATPPSNRSR